MNLCYCSSQNCNVVAAGAAWLTNSTAAIASTILLVTFLSYPASCS